MKEQELWPGGVRLREAEGVFPLGTDAVLLSHFAGISGVKKILDLGCGSGVIPLLLCARAKDASAAGLELDGTSAENARENVRLNGMQERITILQADLRQYRTLGHAGEFDLVTANPPYYPVASGYSARGAASGARQEHTCTLEELCAAAAWFTRWGGRFALVHKPERLSEILCCLSAKGLEPKRLRTVQKRGDSAPSLVLIEARRGAAPGLIWEKPLLMQEENGGESEELRAVYHRG